MRGAQELRNFRNTPLSGPRAPPYKGKATGVKFRDGQVKPGAHNRCLMSASGHWPRPDPRAPRGGCHPRVVFQAGRCQRSGNSRGPAQPKRPARALAQVSGLRFGQGVWADLLWVLVNLGGAAAGPGQLGPHEEW